MEESVDAFGCVPRGHYTRDNEYDQHRFGLGPHHTYAKADTGDAQCHEHRVGSEPQINLIRYPVNPAVVYQIADKVQSAVHGNSCGNDAPGSKCRQRASNYGNHGPPFSRYEWAG